MKSKLLYLFLAFHCSLLIANCSLIYAQWPTTPDTALVIAYGDGPYICSDNNGGALVALQAYPQLVKVKKVDKYGYFQWNGWTGVYVSNAGSFQFSLPIVEDGFEGVLVPFANDTCLVDCGSMWPGIARWVFVQRLDSNGNKLWGEGVRGTLFDSSIQMGPKIISDGHGGCIMGWADTRNNESPLGEPYNDVYVQRIDSNGNRCWGDSAIRISQNVSIYDNNSFSFIMGNNNSVIIRLGDRINRLSPSGIKLWGENGLLIEHTPIARGIPDGYNGAIYGGIDYDNGVYHLLCQRIDSSGNKLWGENGLLIADNISIGSNVSNVLFINDTLYVSYFHNKSVRRDFYIQKISLDGIKHFGENGLLVSPYPSSKTGDMLRSDDSLMFIWNDSRGGVYGQKLDLYGNRLWTDDKLFYSKPYQGITTDNDGGAILLSQFGEFAIGLVKISKYGNIGQVLDVNDNRDENGLIKDFILYQNYPNPFNSSTTIEYHLKKSSHVELGIYNMLGQKIKTPIHAYQYSGNYRMHVDMNGFASGVFIYRLKTNSQTETRKFLFIK